MTARFATLPAVLLSMALAPSAWAGAPMATEDADVLGVNECEWESTANRTRVASLSVRTLSTKAGCGLLPGTQLALGAARSSAAGESANAFGLSGKTALIPRPDGGFGLTLAYGFTWAKTPGDSLRYASTSLALVATQGVGDWTLHANAGLVRERDGGDRRGTWALGAEYALGDEWALLGETYGSDGSDSAWGLGLRWQASKAWSLGLMASQSRGSPKAKDVLFSAKLAF